MLSSRLARKWRCVRVPVRLLTETFSCNKIRDRIYFFDEYSEMPSYIRAIRDSDVTLAPFVGANAVPRVYLPDGDNEIHAGMFKQNLRVPTLFLFLLKKKH